MAALLRGHPLVRDVQLAGSRARGEAHERSDWDWAVWTTDFAALAPELPRLLQPLDPISSLWDPYSEIECYMLMLRGPTKVDVLFPDERRELDDAYAVSAASLRAIDVHFWDWILWLEQKRRGGRDALLAEELPKLHRMLLAPMGVTRPPTTITGALDAYLEARGRLEQIHDLRVTRELQREVEPAVR